jgi:ParB/RepB/Spo0J family partition protein
VEEQFDNLLLSQLRPPKVLLRPVNKRSVAYLEMRDSIRDPQGGLLNSIAVRPATEPDVYEIIDGFYRFTCCLDLGWKKIPCIIKHGYTDERVLAAQVRANAIRPETTPVEFARQLKLLQRLRPEITASDMSRMVGKSVKWVKEQLLLLELNPVAQKAVDRDEMSLMNAYMLAKIPQSYQADFFEQAKTLPPTEFHAIAAGMIRQVMEAIKQGKLERWFVREFKPRPFLKPLKVILKELEAGQIGTKTLLKAGSKTPIEGWKKALEWVASLDPESMEKQQKKATKRQQRQTFERKTLHDSIDTVVPDSDSSVSDTN